VLAVIAAPLRVPAGCLGVLCAYDDEPSVADGVATAIGRIADTLTHTVLQLSKSGQPGDIFDELDYQVVIHQATGMISAYHGCPVGDAEALLRAHAYADGRSVTDVAGDVVGGRTRLNDSDNPAVR
jgi:ANTAR domain